MHINITFASHSWQCISGHHTTVIVMSHFSDALALKSHFSLAQCLLLYIRCVGRLAVEGGVGMVQQKKTPLVVFLSAQFIDVNNRNETNPPKRFSGRCLSIVGPRVVCTSLCLYRHSTWYSMIFVTAWCLLHHSTWHNMKLVTARCLWHHSAWHNMNLVTVWCPQIRWYMVQHDTCYSVVPITS